MRRKILLGIVFILMLQGCSTREESSGKDNRNETKTIVDSSRWMVQKVKLSEKDKINCLGN